MPTARYVDRAVTAGTRYVYAVIAVDDRVPLGNVSLESERVEATAAMLASRRRRGWTLRSRSTGRTATRLRNHMKLFVDTGNLKEIEALAALGILDGATTNPSLMAKEGGDPKRDHP